MSIEMPDYPAHIEVMVTISYGRTTVTRVVHAACTNPLYAALKTEQCVVEAGRAVSAMIAGALGDVRTSEDADASVKSLRPLGASSAPTPRN